VDSSLWPCPKVKESNAACKSAFWPDGDTRRKNGDELREYKTTRDTMACRFYDRFARRSPCEGAKQTCSIVLLDEYETPLAGVPITVAAPSGAYHQTGVTDATGTARFPGAPRGDLTVTASDLPKLATALAPLVAKRPRVKDYPSAVGWTTTIPKLLAQSVTLQQAAVHRVLVVARTDVMFDIPPGWEQLETSESGPWQLTKDGTRAKLALVSQGLGRAVTLHCPATYMAKATSGPSLFATLDVDALHVALFAGHDGLVWQTLSQLPREPRDDGPGLSESDRLEIAEACQVARAGTAAA
jgi:hypothetical protein